MGNMFWMEQNRSGLRERQTSMDILWLELKEQPLHAPLCVVSCFASVHSEPNYPSFSVSWRKSIIHIMGPRWTFESPADVAAIISVSCLTEACFFLFFLYRNAKSQCGRGEQRPWKHFCRLSSTRSLIAVTFLSWDPHSSGNNEKTTAITQCII